MNDKRNSEEWVRIMTGNEFRASAIRGVVWYIGDAVDRLFSETHSRALTIDEIVKARSVGANRIGTPAPDLDKELRDIIEKELIHLGIVIEETLRGGTQGTFYRLTRRGENIYADTVRFGGV